MIPNRASRKSLGPYYRAGLCVSLWGAYPAKPAGWVDQTWHAARVDRVRLDAAEETTD